MSGPRRASSIRTSRTSRSSRALAGGQLAELLQAAGLDEIEASALSVDVEHPSFEEWWEPFTLGVGLGGGYAARLDSARQARLRDLCREMLPTAQFVVTAWA